MVSVRNVTSFCNGRLFMVVSIIFININPLNAELNPICHLLALLGAHHILHVSRIRVNVKGIKPFAVMLSCRLVHFSLLSFP